jgi:hypothetical protein
VVVQELRLLALGKGFDHDFLDDNHYNPFSMFGGDYQRKG